MGFCALAGKGEVMRWENGTTEKKHINITHSTPHILSYVF
jgi:hypothetical protein